MSLVEVQGQPQTSEFIRLAAEIDKTSPLPSPYQEQAPDEAILLGIGLSCQRTKDIPAAIGNPTLKRIAENTATGEAQAIYVYTLKNGWQDDQLVLKVFKDWPHQNLVPTGSKPTQALVEAHSQPILAAMSTARFADAVVHYDELMDVLQTNHYALRRMGLNVFHPDLIGRSCVGPEHVLNQKNLQQFGLLILQEGQRSNIPEATMLQTITRIFQRIQSSFGLRQNGLASLVNGIMEISSQELGTLGINFPTRIFAPCRRFGLFPQELSTEEYAKRSIKPQEYKTRFAGKAFSIVEFAQPLDQILQEGYQDFARRNTTMAPLAAPSLISPDGSNILEGFLAAAQTGQRFMERYMRESFPHQYFDELKQKIKILGALGLVPTDISPGQFGILRTASGKYEVVMFDFSSVVAKDSRVMFATRDYLPTRRAVKLFSQGQLRATPELALAMMEMIEYQIRTSAAMEHLMSSQQALVAQKLRQSQQKAKDVTQAWAGELLT